MGPDGALYVAEAGTGGPTSGAGSDCVTTTRPTDCLGTTGSIARVTTSGAVTTALAGLPSIVTEAAGPVPAEYIGPADTAYVSGKFEVVTEVEDLNADGTNKFGAAGVDLGQLITAPRVRRRAPGQWEPRTSPPTPPPIPSRRRRSGPSAGESATDSDPYAITPYNGGFAVADAAANDLLWVSSTGSIIQLASFPAQSGTGAQAVPTSVAVGPDGDLYVGELVGAPSTGRQRRRLPGGTRSIADGVRQGLQRHHRSGLQPGRSVAGPGVRHLGPARQTGASGAVIQVDADGTQTTLASTGLIRADRNGRRTGRVDLRVERR